MKQMKWNSIQFNSMAQLKRKINLTKKVSFKIKNKKLLCLIEMFL